jgi:hypothetical protein
VLKAQGAESRYVLRPNIQSVALELRERTFHVARVPQNDGIDDEAERPELVFLSLAIALPQFTALTMEDRAGKAVTRFAAIKLDQNASAICFVIDVGEQKKRLGYAADFGDRADKACGICSREPNRRWRRLSRPTSAARTSSSQGYRLGQPITWLTNDHVTIFRVYDSTPARQPYGRCGVSNPARL